LSYTLKVLSSKRQGQLQLTSPSLCTSTKVWRLENQLCFCTPKGRFSCELGVLAAQTQESLALVEDRQCVGAGALRDCALPKLGDRAAGAAQTGQRSGGQHSGAGCVA